MLLACLLVAWICCSTFSLSGKSARHTIRPSDKAADQQLQHLSCLRGGGPEPACSWCRARDSAAASFRVVRACARSDSGFRVSASSCKDH